MLLSSERFWNKNLFSTICFLIVKQIDSMLLNKGTQAMKTGSTTKECSKSFLAFLTYLLSYLSASVKDQNDAIHSRTSSAFTPSHVTRYKVQSTNYNDFNITTIPNHWFLFLEPPKACLFSNSSQRTTKCGKNHDTQLLPHVSPFCSYHFLKSSVIYYSTDALQHGLYLLIRKVWEKEKWSRNKSLRRVFPQLFRVLLNSHECFCNSTETQKTCFLSSFTKHPNKKGKQVVNFDH